MISQHNNLNSHRTPENLQSGVTLLLSVLLLAAITTIAFSLAAVGFAELATSNDLVQTEPIFYSSLGVAEEEIFNIKRKVPGTKPVLPANSACTAWITLSANQLALGGSSARKMHCEYSRNNPAVFEVPLSKNSQDQALKFYLIDPSNAGVGGSGYKEIRLKNISSTLDLAYSLCNYTTESCNPSGATVSAGSAEVVMGLNSSNSYELSVWVTGIIPSTSTSAFLSLETKVDDGLGGTTGRGLPYLNKRAVEVESTYGRLTRRIEALVPLQ